MLIFLVQAEKKVQLQCRTNIDLRISLALVAFLPSIRGTWGPLATSLRSTAGLRSSETQGF